MQAAIIEKIELAKKLLANATFTSLPKNLDESNFAFLKVLWIIIKQIKEINTVIPKIMLIPTT